MLTATRLSALTLLISAAILTSTTPARAGDWYGDVDCAQNPYPGCELGAGTPGHSDGLPPVPDSDPPSPEAQGEGPDAAPPPSDDQAIGGDDNLANCSYVRSDYQPPPQGMETISYRPRASTSGGVRVASVTFRPHDAALAQEPGQRGAWYVYRCSGSGGRDALYRAPVWIPDGATPEPLPSPAELARQARSQLRLSPPRIDSSPAGTQLVNLPTWLWLDRATWQPQSATASVPGMAVTATATPTSTSWSMGDGSTLTCSGPGAPFPAGGDPHAASPDCGHTYHRSSAAEPNEQFPATATVRWRITYSGAGASGALPDLTTTGSASFPVTEAQALGHGGTP